MVKSDPATPEIVMIWFRVIPAGSSVNILHGRGHDFKQTMSRDPKTRRLSDHYSLGPLNSVRFGTRVGVGRHDGRAVSLGAGLAANPGTAVQGIEAVPTTCKSVSVYRDR